MTVRDLWRRIWPPDDLVIGKECPACRGSMAYPTFMEKYMHFECATCQYDWQEAPAFNQTTRPIDEQQAHTTGNEGPTEGMIQE